MRRRAVELTLFLAAASLPVAAAPAAGFSPSPGLDFQVRADSISAQCEAARTRAEKRLEAVVRMPVSARSFSNTPERLEDILDDLNDRTAAQAFLVRVSTSAAVRQASAGCRSMLEDFGAYTGQGAGSEVFSRDDLYHAVSSYAARARGLSPVQARLLRAELRDFKNSGLGLPPERRALLAALGARLAELQTRFQDNLSKVQDYFLATPAELAGIDAAQIAKLPRLGAKYRVDLDRADYDAFMRQAADAGARRRLEFLFHNRAAAQNVGLLRQSLALRQESARLLGYPDDAGLRLQELAQQSPAQAGRLLAQLRRKLFPAARRELSALSALKKRAEGKKADGVIRAWDWPRYDGEINAGRGPARAAARAYFPLWKVTAGIFKVSETLFSVKFSRVAGARAWAPGVALYRVWDSSSGRVLGYFYLDLFSRPGKTKSAAAVPLIDGRLLPDGSYQKPVSAVLADFDRPAPGRPSLLSYGPGSQVQDYFRAFGTLMRQLLSRAPYERFSSLRSDGDFAGMAGEAMENWMWRPEVLALISGRERDPSRPLPARLLKKIAARRADAALRGLRRVFLARYELRLRGAPPVSRPTRLYARLAEKIRLVPMTPGTNPEAGLARLIDGGYYGRLLCRIYAQDVYSRFATEGVLNPAMGWLYRREVLGPGSSRDETASLKNFLGRKPGVEGYWRGLGI